MKTPLLHPVIGTAAALNAAILALTVFWAGTDVARLDQLLIEDRLAEWLQFLCFSVTAVLIAFVAADRWVRRSGLSLEFLALAGLSVLVFAAAGEEISWFQRVLAVDTPEFFQQNNRQGETNLHNLQIGGVNLHKTILLKLIVIVGITHNLILPWLARSRPVVRRWVESLGLYLPPLSAGIAYLVLVILSQLLVDHPRKGELGETFGAIHYLSTACAAYLAGVAYDRAPVFESAPDRRRLSILFALFLGFLVLVALLLGRVSAG